MPARAPQLAGPQAADRRTVMVPYAGTVTAVGGAPRVAVTLPALPLALAGDLPPVAGAAPLPPAPFGRCATPGCGTALPVRSPTGDVCAECARATRPWSQAERALLRRLDAQNAPFAQMFQALRSAGHPRRTRDAVQCELARLRGAR